MSRMAIKFPEREISAVATLEPSGNHQLEIEVEGCSYQLSFSQAQAKWMQKAISQFLQECAFDDGRPVDRLHRHKVHLMHKIEVNQ